MSGHKRATIRLSDADFRKLVGIEEKLRKVDADYQDIIRRSRQGSTEVISEGIQEIRERHEKLIHELSHFQNEFSLLEQRTSRNLIHSLDILENNLNAHVSETMLFLSEALLNDTQDVIAQQQENIYRILELNNQERHEEITNIINQLQNKNNISEFVENTFHTCETLIKHLECFTANPFFIKHWGQKFLFERNKHEMAISNYENGFHEAALTLSQECFLELAQLRDHWDIQWLNRQLTLSDLLNLATSTLEYCKSIRLIPAIGFNGEELETVIDLDVWSRGDYSKIRSELEQIYQELQCGAVDKDDEEFHFLRITLDQLSKELGELVYRSRLAALSSQLRFNIARNVVKALLKQGFLLEKGFYIDSDPRQEYQAKLKHMDGSEVVIQVSGEEDSFGETCLDIYSLDYEIHTEHERRQRMKEMAEYLNYYGLKVSNMSIQNDQFIPTNDRNSRNNKSIKETRAIYYGRN